MSIKVHLPFTFGYPKRTGLYDPSNEKDSCGVGFVADIKGRPSHEIMLDAYHLNSRMDHRGGCGFEANTGDGAGILMALPHSFFSRVAREELGITLPAPGDYAVGNIFLPQLEDERSKCVAVINAMIAEEGQTLLGWRDVPVDPAGADVGPAARTAQPHIAQLYVGAEAGLSREDFERRLYVIRKRFTHKLRGDASLSQAKMLYACSLSTKVIVYKGMLTPGQLFPFYHDLTNPECETHLAMVHSRFSTNTFPSWDRAQPNRFMSHNGEINTLRGNVNQMVAREGTVKSDLFGKNMRELFPVIDADFRLRAGVHADVWPFPAGSRDDDDSGSLAVGRQHAGGQKGLLRIPFRADGTLGRPRLHRVLGRPLHRRRARPQRPASQPLLRHPRRQGHHGLGSGRGARRARACEAQGQAAAGPHVPAGLRAGAYDSR
jgi:glutamate synthase (NADPH/NADH) large chain